MKRIKLLVIMLGLVCLFDCRRVGEVIGKAGSEFGEGVASTVGQTTEKRVEEMRRKTAEDEHARKMADPNYNPYWDPKKGRR